MYPTRGTWPQVWSVLAGPHRVRVTVWILDNSRRFLANASDMLIDGQVDIDAGADITRSGQLRLLDPGHVLGLDASPSAGIVAYNRMVHIIYTAEKFDQSMQFSWPVFTGPISKSNRDGPILDLEFVGMEKFAHMQMPYNWTWPVGWSKGSVISNALMQHTGEIYFDMDWRAGGYPLSAPWTLEEGENLWPRLKNLAEEMNMRMFYDGNGVLKVRGKDMTSVIEFLPWMLTGEDPQVSYDLTKMRNHVKIKGKTPPGMTGAMGYDAYPPAHHPYSPQSLARNGFNRFFTEFVEDDQLEWTDMVNRAWSILSEKIMTSMDVQFTSCVVPFMEEWDVFSINHPRVWVPQAMFTKSTIPLVGDAEQSIGYMSTTSQGSSRVSNFATQPLLGPKGKIDPGGIVKGLGPKKGNKDKNKDKKHKRNKKKKGKK